ncbi:hypothetical protein H0E87_017123 [Populus deltoides]|uniref:Uncharacterized protein n=1 Tax=Populus deltoides TaxID=3696 RepID=A0A8T2XYZ0_POPDE|nr:hypothetical protein H0E87_017123 [Populus deltoides]
MFQFLEMGVILVILVMLVSMVQYDSLSLIFSCFGVACFRIFIPFTLKPLPYPVLTGNRVLYSAGAEFQNILNLSAGDLVSTELRLDKKIGIPFARNACSSFDDSSGWNFFELNELFVSHYHGNELLPLKGEYIATKVMSYLSKCVKDFKTAQHVSHWTLFDRPFLLHLESAAIVAASSTSFPSSFLSTLAYLPLEGSSKYMMRGFSPFPNLHFHGWRLDYNAARIMVTGTITLLIKLIA